MHFHKKKEALVITTGAFFLKICNQVISHLIYFKYLLNHK